MPASPPRPAPLQPLLTEIRVAAPSGWKLQDTDAALLITSTDVNVHGSLASVPFSTNISSGVFTSTADTWTAWERQREERRRTRPISAALRMRKFTSHCLQGQKTRGISNSCIGWLHRHCIIPAIKQAESRPSTFTSPSLYYLWQDVFHSQMFPLQHFVEVNSMVQRMSLILFRTSWQQAL